MFSLFKIYSFITSLYYFSETRALLWA